MIDKIRELFQWHPYSLKGMKYRLKYSIYPEDRADLERRIKQLEEMMSRW